MVASIVIPHSATANARLQSLNQIRLAHVYDQESLFPRYLLRLRIPEYRPNFEILKVFFQILSP